jgi:hypothetical protein
MWCCGGGSHWDASVAVLGFSEETRVTDKGFPRSMIWFRGLGRCSQLTFVAASTLPPSSISRLISTSSRAPMAYVVSAMVKLPKSPNVYLTTAEGGVSSFPFRSLHLLGSSVVPLHSSSSLLPSTRSSQDV